MKQLLLIIGCLSLVAGFSIPADAGTTGTIFGRIVDPNGYPIPGVVVSLSGKELLTNRVAITNSNGFYNLQAIPPGFYVLNASHDELESINQRGIIVGVNTRLKLIIVMVRFGVCTSPIDFLPTSCLMSTSSVHYSHEFLDRLP